MLFAVVPAQNEEKRIGVLLEQLAGLAEIHHTLLVINGSTDRTAEVVKKSKIKHLTTVIFRESLGIDVPRAIGAYHAYRQGAGYILFVDGDLTGDIAGQLKELIDNSIKGGLDLGLTDCYPSPPPLNHHIQKLFFFRQMLSRETGLDKKIGISSPSHGPHLVSRRLLDHIPFRELAIPPVEMVMAWKKGLSLDIGTVIPHRQLGSSVKGYLHNHLIVQTIAGDCLEALCLFRDIPRQRTYEGQEYTGYHRQRRWDLLDKEITP